MKNTKSSITMHCVSTTHNLKSFSLLCFITCKSSPYDSSAYPTLAVNYKENRVSCFFYLTEHKRIRLFSSMSNIPFKFQRKESFLCRGETFLSVWLVIQGIQNRINISKNDRDFFALFELDTLGKLYVLQNFANCMTPIQSS